MKSFDIMKFRGLFILVMVLAGTLVQAEQVEGKGVRLFILSGQSNMANLDPSHTFMPRLKEAFPEEEVLVVKDAQSGQPIRRWHKDWKPASGGERPRADGALYERLMKKVHETLQGREPDTVTFIWMQGERDAREGHGTVYEASLRALLEQVRQDLKREKLFVVIGRISDYGIDNPERPDWDLVRTAQVAVANTHPEWVWVDTDDLNGPKNALHYTKEGYTQLGKRFADAAITLIRDAEPAPPESAPGL